MTAIGSVSGPRVKTVWIGTGATALNSAEMIIDKVRSGSVIDSGHIDVTGNFNKRFQQNLVTRSQVTVGCGMNES